jgi:hypothetical protein
MVGGAVGKGVVGEEVGEGVGLAVGVDVGFGVGWADGARLVLGGKVSGEHPSLSTSPCSTKIDGVSGHKSNSSRTPSPSESAFVQS